MEFLVIDFETACPDNSSICQVGLVKYENGECITLIDSLVNPQTEFTYSQIHSIKKEDVIDAPIFPEIYPQLERFMKGQVVFNHNGADKSKFEDACKKWNLPIFKITWLNSGTLVQKTWKQFSRSGYGLEAMCRFLNINYKPHHAASDSRATAEIIRQASKIKGYSIKDWILEVKQTSGKSGGGRGYINYDHSQRITGDITVAPDLSKVENKDNPFYDKKVVISGTYNNWPDRRDLAKVLNKLGGDIQVKPGKKTNILCAGKGVGPKKIELMEQKIESGEDALILEEEEIIEILNNL